MQTINETWAEVLEGGFQMLWPGMSDEQKLALVRYAKKHLGKITSDGIKITWDRFGQAVGATGKALSEHYRRSEGQNSTSRAPVQRALSESRRLPVRERATLAQELLADPEVAAQALDGPDVLDPTSATAAAAANVARVGIQKDRRLQVRQERNGNPARRAIRQLDALTALKKALREHAEQVAETLMSVGQLDDGERFFLIEALEKSEEQNRQVRRYVELGHTALDEEIRSLMESEL